MHEFSLVRSLISLVIDVAKPVAPAWIRTVHVSLGPLTGVEPVLVQQAFKSSKLSAGLAECGLEIDEQKLEAVCRDCASAFEVVDFVFRCPLCRSGSVRITQGDEFRLLSIEVDESLESWQAASLQSTALPSSPSQLSCVTSNIESGQDE